MPRILLVEDNSHNTRLVEQLVEDIDEKIELVKASSGEIALQIAKEKEFDLVLMDISLPDMDGITITRELKKYPKFENIPFIVVSAHAMTNDEITFRKIFDDYISKPIDEDVFTQKIRKWMCDKL